MAMTTTNAREDAERLARDLVERRLAACVQVLGPISSTYRWQGAVESAEEWLCLIKTTAARFDAVGAHIDTSHGYETPRADRRPGRPRQPRLPGLAQLGDREPLTTQRSRVSPTASRRPRAPGGSGGRPSRRGRPGA